MQSWNVATCGTGTVWCQKDAKSGNCCGNSSLLVEAKVGFPVSSAAAAAAATAASAASSSAAKREEEMPGVEGSDCWGYCGCVSGDGVFGCPVWVVVVVEEAEGSEAAAGRSFKSGIRERIFSKTTLAGQDTSGSACGLCGDD